MKVMNLPNSDSMLRLKAICNTLKSYLPIDVQRRIDSHILVQELFNNYAVVNDTCHITPSYSIT